MVDIVIMSDSVFQMHIVVDGSKDVFLCDMLRNKVMDISLDSSFDILKIIIFFQNLFEYRIVY